MMTRDNGFQEVVGLVVDARASAARLCAATGFVERHVGPVASGALVLLGIGERSGHEVLIGHPQVERGAIRLITLDGDPGGVMRDGAQAWDSGGLFDINLRALGSIEVLHRNLTTQGFAAASPITDWDFGPLSVREVVSRDGDGLCIALMERVRPSLTGYEGLFGPASWVFNATQVVSDFGAARRFYVEALGWQVVQETEGTAALMPDGRNCMGLPRGLAGDVAMRIGIYHPQGWMEGSVEIIAFGCGGHDFSAAAPPDRGWASVRFVVSDLGAFVTAAGGGGCAVVGPVDVEWAPHGRARAAAVITPWGARLEAFELV
jgi:catechol 2,3-dioxygenase-like lactoylglutathione lyase family enzyme